MITFSIIQKSQLEGDQRLDAEYYQPEYFIDFSKGKWRPIGEMLELCQYGISQAMEEEKIGYPIFKMDDIKNAFLVDDNVKYVSISKNIFEQYRLRKDDVLFNRVNSEEFVGRTGIFKYKDNYTFASYLIRLRVKNEANILPDYLNIFLNSSYGIRQIRKYRRRAVNQANVNAEELKQIKVAVLPKKTQDKIAEYSNLIWEKMEESKSLYSQAENLLLEELGLKGHQIKGEIASVIKLSEVKEAGRMDAEYFQAKYEILVAKIKQFKHEKLSGLVKRIIKTSKILPEKTYRYIEISDINVGNGEATYNEMIGRELPASAKISINGGELIVSKVRPTRGAVSIVPEYFNKDFICSSAFSVFAVPNNLKEYLFVVLRSIVGKLQMEKPTTGTSYPTITDEDVENLIIPILSGRIQQKIADLVQRSHEARKKAKELLDEAKRKVEEMIEKRSN